MCRGQPIDKAKDCSVVSFYSNESIPPKPFCCFSATQGGPFNNVPASGKKIKVRGMQISKFNSDAKIVKRRGASHEIGILQQIGDMKPVAHLDEPPVISALV
ncbi:MAG: hypothetical protein ACRYFU_21005 [Janthinobacterium lividum]